MIVGISELTLVQQQPRSGAREQRPPGEPELPQG